MKNIFLAINVFWSCFQNDVSTLRIKTLSIMAKLWHSVQDLSYAVRLCLSLLLCWVVIYIRVGMLSAITLSVKAPSKLLQIIFSLTKKHRCQKCKTSSHGKKTSLILTKPGINTAKYSTDYSPASNNIAY
jgi:hypothetical protein